MKPPSPYRWLFTTSMLLLILLILGSLVTPALAQQESFQDSFDDPTLPGWEHSREVVVQDGVLEINAGGFALHIGDWSQIDLQVQMRLSGQGEMAVNYYFRDENHYALVLNPDHIVLQRIVNRSPGPLGEALYNAPRQEWFTLRIQVEGQQHQVWIDEQLLLTASDEQPLMPGAILFLARGELTVELDDLQVNGFPGRPPAELLEGPAGETPGEPLPPDAMEPQPAGEQDLPQEQQVAATAQADTTSDWDALVDEFFASQANPLELTTFLINLSLAALSAYILSLAYIHWGTSLSNRRRFAANFMLMTITTTFIILVVRSSVALSLGLVGALSIIRFRTAIKEPEELAFLFFAIGIGIGLGDNQRLITLLALAAGIALTGLRHLFRRPQADVNLHLTITSPNPLQVSLEQITGILEQHTAKLKLLRLDETPNDLEAAFLVEFRRASDLNQARAALRALSDSLEITFMDNKGLW